MNTTVVKINLFNADHLWCKNFIISVEFFQQLKTYDPIFNFKKKYPKLLNRIFSEVCTNPNADEYTFTSKTIQDEKLEKYLLKDKDGNIIITQKPNKSKDSCDSFPYSYSYSCSSLSFTM